MICQICPAKIFPCMGVYFIFSVFCIENPPEKYWEIMAEKRRVALAETLKENMEVCFVVMVMFDMEIVFSFTRRWEG